jgi:5'-3' exonuclease
VNSKGFNTSAAFGFTTTLLDLIKREKPTHIAVVFDTAAPTERHISHVDYKANREEMPDDIRSNVPYIRRIIEAMNIPVLESDGYEADDVIGTLAKKAEAEGYTTYMVTPDKDFGQLVTDKIIMYKPGRGGDPPEKLGTEGDLRALGPGEHRSGEGHPRPDGRCGGQHPRHTGHRGEDRDEAGAAVRQPGRRDRTRTS